MHTERWRLKSFDVWQVQQQSLRLDPQHTMSMQMQAKVRERKREISKKYNQFLRLYFFIAAAKES